MREQREESCSSICGAHPEFLIIRWLLALNRWAALMDEKKKYKKRVKERHQEGEVTRKGKGSNVPRRAGIFTRRIWELRRLLTGRSSSNLHWISSSSWKELPLQIFTGRSSANLHLISNPSYSRPFWINRIMQYRTICKKIAPFLVIYDSVGWFVSFFFRYESYGLYCESYDFDDYRLGW